MLLDKKNLHFVGVGGIGMSGIALVLSEMGYNVSGSDLEPNDLTGKLEDIGVKIFKGHSSSNLPKETDVLVYSSAINRDNPEYREALKNKVKIAHRADMLGELLNAKKGIAVTGTHGKTTTTSLVAVMLEEASFNPTVIIGGEVDRFRGNAKLGSGQYLVAEADESDSSFLKLKPFYSVVTNIEMEHLDHYKTLEDVLASYRKFIDNTKKGGSVFYNNEDAHVRSVLKGFRASAESFGFSKEADMRAVGIKMAGFRTSFQCVYKGRPVGRVELRIPGRHNVSNCLAAILVGLKMGISFNKISQALRSFSGAKRRFQLRADAGGVMLIDDYAHHPTEISMVLDACRNWKRKRIIAIFQPHRYSRTLFLADEFGRCFAGADKLILTDIYAASETPIEGVSARTIYDKVVRSGMKDVSIMKKGDIVDWVMKHKKAGDMILVLGAGDIKEMADELTDRLNGSAGHIDEKALEEFKRLIKGRVLFKEPLSSHTTFKIGGPASIWVEPEDEKELKKTLLLAKEKKIPAFVMGRGSNILVRDSGFNGVVINLSSPCFKKIAIKGSRVKVGGGYSLSQLVRLCCDRSLGGLESLVGIPGTLGGAICMNAGGWTSPIYRNIGDFVTSLKVMDHKGTVRNLKREDIKFGYRSSNLKKLVVLEAGLKLEKTDKATLNSRCMRFLKIKKEKQVLDAPSAGCIFKNPPDFQFTCGQLIDMLGFKGKRLGGAEISAKHANFIINRKDATCEDVMGLVEFIKAKASENYNIGLELEIEIV